MVAGGGYLVRGESLAISSVRVDAKPNLGDVEADDQKMRMGCGVIQKLNGDESPAVEKRMVVHEVLGVRNMFGESSPEGMEREDSMAELIECVRHGY